MFGFLKKKLKETVDRFSKKAEEESVEISEEELTDTQVEELTKEEVQEEVKEDFVDDVEEKVEDQVKKDVKEDIEEAVVEESEKKPEESDKDVEEELTKIDKKEVGVEEAVVDFDDTQSSDDLSEKDSEEVIVEESEKEIEESKEELISESQTAEPSADKGSFFSRIFKKKKSEDELEEEKLFDEVKTGDDSEKELEANVQEEVEEKSEPEVVEEEPEQIVEDVKAEVKVEKAEDASKSEQIVEDVKDEVSSSSVDEETSSTPVVSDSVKIVDEVDVSLKKEAVHKELLDDNVKDFTKKKKGFFGKIKEKIVKFKLTDDAFEDLFWDFELGLMENNVALEVIEKIKTDLKSKLTQENVSRRSIEQIMFDTLKQSLEEVLDVPTFDLLSKVKSKKPFVISVIGVNGSGKTTTLAKLIKLFQKNNLSVVVAAADTFRAAAIQQLEQHTTKLGVKLIKHDYNADPSAVAYDAVKHATAKNIDVVLIDTAGRLHANTNLMDELKKLIRVNKPDLNLFVGESITGNDCVEQAVAFNDAVGIDGIILSKADVDDKGGAAISVSYVTGKPILYLGTGQTYDDLKVFEKQLILNALGL